MPAGFVHPGQTMHEIQLLPTHKQSGHIIRIGFSVTGIQGALIRQRNGNRRGPKFWLGQCVSFSSIPTWGTISTWAVAIKRTRIVTLQRNSINMPSHHRR